MGLTFADDTDLPGRRVQWQSGVGGEVCLHGNAVVAAQREVDAATRGRQGHQGTVAPCS
jgi:hypothetical protein